MLDSFKTLTGGSNHTRKQADELQVLIASAREERGALSAMLTQISGAARSWPRWVRHWSRSVRRPRPATLNTQRLDSKGPLDDRSRRSTASRSGWNRWSCSRRRAEADRKADRTDGVLQKHRRRSSTSRRMRSKPRHTIDTLRKERATLEDLRVQLRQATTDVKRRPRYCVAQERARHGPLSCATLTQEFQKIRDTSRGAPDPPLRPSQ